MRRKDFPLGIAYGYPAGENDFEFVAREGLVRLGDCQKELLAVLPHCTGLRPLEEILQELKGFDSGYVHRLLSLCERHGVIVDSRSLYKVFHADSSNPSQFHHDMSLAHMQRLQERNPLQTLPDVGPVGQMIDGLDARCSIRSFTGQPVEENILRAMMRNLYRITPPRTVPSGGALYPLRIFVLVLRDSGTLTSGIYGIDGSGQTWTSIGDLPVQEDLQRVFDTRDLLRQASTIVVISADLDRAPLKYANRGYRYALLEAGHVAQNGYLFCAGPGRGQIGTVEFGGFLDRELSDLLEHGDPHRVPLITMICGVPSGASHRPVELFDRDQVRATQERLMGRNKPIESIGVWRIGKGGQSMARWAAVAAFRHPLRLDRPAPRRMRAYATSPLLHEARAKVMAEAFERFITQSPSVKRVGLAPKDDAYLDPREFAPYPEDHPVHQRYGLTPFDPKQRRGWRLGTIHGHEKRIWVPADLLYFEVGATQSQSCYRANSSGVAAHREDMAARQHAFLELIERDALAVHWYARKSPRGISDEQLPDDLIHQKHGWEHRGWTIRFLDLTLEEMPVVLALFVNKTGGYPAVASGAGCHPTPEVAMIKAYYEAEYMALSWRGRRRLHQMQPENVRTPDQHGLLHATGLYLSTLDPLLAAAPGSSEMVEGDHARMYDRHRPVFVKLTDRRAPLTVYRALSQSLLPMTFGYATEHHGHPRMSLLGLSWEQPFPSVPHFFP